MNRINAQWERKHDLVLGQEQFSQQTAAAGENAWRQQEIHSCDVTLKHPQEPSPPNKGADRRAKEKPQTQPVGITQLSSFKGLRKGMKIDMDLWGGGKQNEET